jgi:hypothetical protein
MKAICSLLSTMLQTFICYARVDIYLVRQLVGILYAGGYDPWFDHRLLPGQDWKAQLRDAISRCGVFIYALTPESVESEWCNWEFSNAVNLGKPIIPVLLQANTPLPEALSRYQYVDFSQGPTPEATARLLSGLAAVAVKISQGDAPAIAGHPLGAPSLVPVEAISVYQSVTRPARLSFAAAVTLPRLPPRAAITLPSWSNRTQLLRPKPALKRDRRVIRWALLILLIMMGTLLALGYGIGGKPHTPDHLPPVSSTACYDAPTPTCTVLPAETITPQKTITAASPCTGGQPSQLAVGMLAQIPAEMGADFRLRIRQEPGLDSPAVSRIRPGTAFHIIDGPVCENNLVWWEVKIDNGSTGWAAESDKRGYYMMPIIR